MPTVDHFLEWAPNLILGSYEPWQPDPWFIDFARDVFARDEEGLPLFSECWCIVPEGNSKTTSVAGLCLYILAHQRDAKMPIAASARDQARILYDQGEGFIRRSPKIEHLFRPLFGSREIRLASNPAAKMQIYAADERTGDGIIPNSLAVLDELHRHKNLGLYRTWRGKLFKEGGQILVISTAGEPKSDFELTRAEIRQQGTQTHKPGFVRSEAGRVVLHDWAISPEDDQDNLQAVKAANPSPRITIDTLREKHDSPTMTAQHWARFVCNRATRGALAAITESEWAAAYTDAKIPDGAEVWVGLDCAWKGDTTAMVPLWDRDDETCVIGEATILTPPRDGTQLDLNIVKDALRELRDRYRIRAIVMDISYAADVAQWIPVELDVDLIERPQTNKLAILEYEDFMAGLRTGKLLHSGDPGLTSHVMNAIALQLPEGKSRFARPKESRSSAELQALRVIDALKAASMAHSQIIVERSTMPKEPPRAFSLYDIEDDEDVAA